MVNINKLLIITLFISGCALQRQAESWDDLSKSKAAYKQCLSANSSNPKVCQALKEAYEADAKTFDSTRIGNSANISNTLNAH